MADVNVYWWGVVASLVLIFCGLFCHFGFGYVVDQIYMNQPHGYWETTDFYIKTTETGQINESINRLYFAGYLCYGLGLLILIQSVYRRTRRDEYVYR